MMGCIYAQEGFVTSDFESPGPPGKEAWLHATPSIARLAPGDAVPCEEDDIHNTMAR